MSNGSNVNVLTIGIHLDMDAECPMDFDGAWTLYSFNSRHTHYEDPGVFFNETKTGYVPKIGIQSKLRAGTAFILSYYEHGNCVWSRQGTGPQCQWDNVPTGGILLWEHKLSDMGAKTPADRAKDADGFLKEYTAWSNGEAFGYSIDTGDGEGIDSYWGFYDTDYMTRENIVPAVSAYMAKNDFTKIEASYASNDNGNGDGEKMQQEPGTLCVSVHGDAASIIDLSDLEELGGKAVTEAIPAI